MEKEITPRRESKKPQPPVESFSDETNLQSDKASDVFGRYFKHLLKKSKDTIIRAEQAEARADKAEALANKAKQESITDPLTHVYNRQFFTEFTNDYEKDPNHGTFAFVMLDVVDLKSFNDNFGHAAGDFLLTSAANSLKKLGLNESDFLVRWGGDEFVFVYKVTNANDKITDEIDAQINKAIDEFKNTINEYCAANSLSFNPNISFGVALTDGENPYDAIECADKLMYAHKTEQKFRGGEIA